MHLRKYVLGFALAATVQTSLLVWIPGAINLSSRLTLFMGSGKPGARPNPKSMVKAKIEKRTADRLPSAVEEIGKPRHDRDGGVTVADGPKRTTSDQQGLPPLSIQWPESTADLAEIGRQYRLVFQAIGPAGRVLGEIVPSTTGWTLRPWVGVKFRMSNRVRSLAIGAGQWQADHIYVLVPADVDRDQFAAAQSRELERLGLKREEAEVQQGVFQKKADGTWVLSIEQTRSRNKSRRTEP